MRNFNSLSAALLVALCSTVVQAQSSASQSVPAQAAQIVHLSASASAQVTQDWLVMTLATQKEGADAATVQKQIKTQSCGQISGTDPELSLWPPAARGRAWWLTTCRWR